MSFYFVDGDKQYYPGVELEIIHSDWAYLKQVGVFAPTHYKVIGRTDAGTLEFDADVAGGFLAGSTGKVPDAPVFSLYWDNVVGKFTYEDWPREESDQRNGQHLDSLLEALSEHHSAGPCHRGRAQD